jgi:hypothetical protein
MRGGASADARAGTRCDARARRRVFILIRRDRTPPYFYDLAAPHTRRNHLRPGEPEPSISGEHR